MQPQNEPGAGLIEAVDGGHLHWLDFRETVLQPFRIRCSPTPRNERLPTTFLARLKASQANLNKYDLQRQAWRFDVSEDRGFNASPLFPPNVVPPLREDCTIRRIMSPRMSREGLPLRASLPKASLYELPTSKPLFVSGFSTELFEETEQHQLGGGLTVTGTVVDFSRGEVLPGKTLTVPFLAFHKFDSTSEEEVEAARNSCAISGAQCLRSQQQLFHKAFGLQQVSDPPITFTCALNNDQAIINCHYIDDNGQYTMAALCRFSMDHDEHFKIFQAWIEAIESWASIYLLPRIQGAIHQVMRSNLSPPPSPPPANTGTLHIDTKSDSIVPILHALRRLWPTIKWRNDNIGETPINSSIAQCGTPLNARQTRGMALPGVMTDSAPFPTDKIIDFRPYSSISQRMPDLTPIRTDIPLSARPRVHESYYHHRFSSTTSLHSLSNGSMTSESPCRPPSLSPCTPGPEAPVSAKSPILVLQKRLDVAMNEIQELRVLVEDLQGQVTGRTEVLERRLDVIVERQEEMSKTVFENGGSQTRKRSGTWIQQLETLIEDNPEIHSPIVRAPTRQTFTPDAWGGSPDSPNIRDMAMPGCFPPRDVKGEAAEMQQKWLTEELVFWCLAVLFKDDRLYLAAVVLGAAMIAVRGTHDGEAWCINIAIALAFDNLVQGVMWQCCARLADWFHAVRAYDLDQSRTEIGDAPTPGVEETVTLVLA